MARYLLLSIIILHSALSISSAQVVRLPAVTPPEEGPPGRLVSHPDSSSEILQLPGDLGVPPATSPQQKPPLPPGVRNGVFQKILLDATWLAPGGYNGMGMTDIGLEAIFALPCPTIESPLLITPGYGVYYLDGPQRADLPPRLNEGYVQFRWLAQITAKFGLDVSITPGVYSDFQQEASDSFRITGHAAGAWNLTDKAKLVLGAAYLDRPDVQTIPIGGVVWTPHEDVKFDMVFPHPRISRRIRWSWNTCDQQQDWLYIAGEFAGDAWAIERSDGTPDQVVLSDYRVILGLERRVAGGLSSKVEIGYVFSRRIRYTSDTPEYWPTDTVMIRGGLTY